MPINNITQTISTIPEAGSRGVDVQTQFVIKQEDFQDHLQGTTVTELNTLKDQLNTRIGEINSTTTTMNGYATSASSSATTATTKAGEASTSASEALTSRNQASTFATNSSNSATKASQWADNNYNVAVEAGKYSAKHWATEAQNVVLDTVKLTGNQTIAGIKTFSASPIVPTPTTNTQATNKAYADLKQSKSELAYNVDTSNYIPNTLTSGAIIERGSNANGEYVKFADGTLICTAVLQCSGNVDIQLGSLYTTPSTTWYFPAVFIGYNDYILSGTEKHSVGNCFLTRANGENEGSTSCSFKGTRGAPIQNAPGFGLMAVGRWK